jgi:hypothetical protein
VHFPVINIDWQKSPVPATDLAEIVFLKFQFLPIESIRLSGPPSNTVDPRPKKQYSHKIIIIIK